MTLGAGKVFQVGKASVTVSKTAGRVGIGVESAVGIYRTGEGAYLISQGKNGTGQIAEGLLRLLGVSVSLIPRNAGRSRLLNSIEDASIFEQQFFGKRVVDEDTLADVQGALEAAYSSKGLTFEGIFTGKGQSEFVPTYDDAGNIIGGRINLVGTSKRQPLIRVVDEVSHATDALDPEFTLRYQRLLSLGRAGGAERAREFAHFQLFRRAAKRFEANDPMMRMRLTEDDIPFLRELARLIRQ